MIGMRVLVLKVEGRTLCYEIWVIRVLGHMASSMIQQDL